MKIKIELPIQRMIEKQLALDPDFDIEIIRDNKGKIKSVHTDKEEIRQERDKKKLLDVNKLN